MRPRGVLTGPVLVRVLHLTSKRTVRPFEWPSLVTVQFPFGGFSPTASGTMMVHGAIHRWAFSHADIQQPAISRGPAPFLWGGHHRPDRRRRPVFPACAGQAALALGRHAVQCPLPRRLLHRRNGRDGGAAGLESLVARQARARHGLHLHRHRVGGLVHQSWLFQLRAQSALALVFGLSCFGRGILAVPVAGQGPSFLQKA